MKKAFIKPEMKAASFAKTIKCSDNTGSAATPDMGNVKYYSLQSWAGAQVYDTVTEGAAKASDILKWHNNN